MQFTITGFAFWLKSKPLKPKTALSQVSGKDKKD
jgi:hypothetical protein